MGPSNSVVRQYNAPEDFTIFPKLPTELQLTVWSLAIQRSRPRIVTIASRQPSGLIRGKPLPKRCYALKDDSDLMSLAHTCTQSRALVFNKYNYQFSFAQHLGRPILFNLIQDTLFMSDLETLTLFFSSAVPAPGVEITAVRRLAIYPSVVDSEELQKVLVRSMCRFGGLAEVTLVAPDSKCLLDYRIDLTEDVFCAWLERCMGCWKMWWLEQPADVTGRKRSCAKGSI